MIYFATACGTLVAISVLSLLPFKDKQLIHTTGRYHYWGHFSLFALLAFLAAGALRNKRQTLIAVACMILFGLTIELYEYMIGEGWIEWRDVLTDSCGSVAGAVIGRFWRSVWRPKPRDS